MNASPTDLSRLHDVVTAPSVSWWPPAIGWFVIGGFIVLALIGLGWRWSVERRRNAYRRQARAILAKLGSNAESVPMLAILLRRVALTAYPRDRIVPLVGPAWLAFLDRSNGGGTTFRDGPGRWVAEIPYSPQPIPPDEVRELIDAARWWIDNHRVPPPAEPTC